MGLKKVTGIWERSCPNGQRFLRLNFGLMGSHVLAHMGGNRWDLICVSDDDDKSKDVLVGQLTLRVSDSGREYLLLNFGSLGRFLVFRNTDKLGDKSPDWTLNVEVKDEATPTSENSELRSRSYGKREVAGESMPEYAGAGFSEDIPY